MPGVAGDRIAHAVLVPREIEQQAAEQLAIRVHVLDEQVVSVDRHLDAQVAQLVQLLGEHRTAELEDDDPRAPREARAPEASLGKQHG